MEVPEAAHRFARPQEMGLGGVFLFTKTPAAIGTNIELIFDVPEGEVRAPARPVAAHKPGRRHGIAVRQHAAGAP